MEGKRGGDRALTNGPHLPINTFVTLGHGFAFRIGAYSPFVRCMVNISVFDILKSNREGLILKYSIFSILKSQIFNYDIIKYRKAKYIYGC